MPYQYLGKRGPVTGAADATGLNSGNWTIAFTPAILAFPGPELLVYKMNVIGAPGSSFDVYIENVQHDANIFGAQNSWFDDSDSLLIRPGENLYLLYSDVATDGLAPVATIFLRYDMAKWGKQFG
jgi:hypothetical protein